MIECDYVNRHKLEKIRMLRTSLFIEGIPNGVKEREINNNNMNASVNRLRKFLDDNAQLTKTQGMQNYDKIQT